MKSSKIKTIAYSGIIGDLFHYGHLHSILFAKSISDYNVCGVLTDEAVEKQKAKPITNFEERKAVISHLDCIDQIMTQHDTDPTENLKKLHEQFPNAKIILVHGSDWKHIYGSEFLKSINGEIIQHPYYERLSEFKIINQILENKNKLKNIIDFASLIKGEIKLNSEIKNKKIISTKANTLKALKPILKQSKIEELIEFTTTDWKNKQELTVKQIQEKFNSSKIIVRSSAISEDTFNNSMAGFFDSILDIDSSDKEDIIDAVNFVINSYKTKGAESSFNQVLIQKQTENIIISGVIFTRTLEKNAPYYVINYDDSTGLTDTVTKGIENKTIFISHFTKSFPEKFKPVLKSIKEIEDLIPEIPLDIEFAVNQNQEVIIFQVRPLAANINLKNQDNIILDKLEQFKNQYQRLIQKPDHLVGETTYFADMPDWNPAEIIGDNPNLLDISLYDYIIMDSAWHEARSTQNYYNVNPAKLMITFGNKPYVDVRKSFNSFTPANISQSLRNKLVNFYLDKLKNNPKLQDKVEFEILYTCYDLCFQEKSQELLAANFSNEEINQLKYALLNLTNKLILNSKDTIPQDVNSVLSMDLRRKEIIQQINSKELTAKELIDFAKELLDECRKKGTVQFSRLARLAFIAKIILKSLVKKEIINQEFYDSLFNSISTVATELNQDFFELNNGNLTKEEFIQKYYHLRPGSYNINNLRYDSNPLLFTNNSITTPIKNKEKSTFKLTKDIEEKINQALISQGLEFNAKTLIEFIKTAIETRESSKFEFSKNLSDALELIAKAGEKKGFTRQELAMIDINDLFKINSQVFSSEQVIDLWKEIIQNNIKEKHIHDQIILPPIIFDKNDFEIIKYYKAKPNFITQKTIESEIIVLNDSNNKVHELENKIVAIENGDPGYDWIFTKNIKGLVTKYGGVASHMAIRCAEFGIPAAIGCGEEIFNRIIKSKKIIIDSKNKKIRTK